MSERYIFLEYRELKSQKNGYAQNIRYITMGDFCESKRSSGNMLAKRRRPFM